MGVVMGPSYYEGVRISPENYGGQTNIAFNPEISFNTKKQGAEVHVGVDEKGRLKLESSDGHGNFGDWYPKRKLSLTENEGKIQQIDIMTQAIEDVRASMIHLNFGGKKIGTKNMEGINGLCLQSNRGDDFVTSEAFSITAEGYQGRQWTLVEPDLFTADDVKKTMEQALKDVEDLLANFKFSGTNSGFIKQEIMDTLEGFGGEIMYVRGKNS